LADNVRDITMNVTANTRQAEESLARLKGATEQAATSINKKAAASANGQTSLIAFSRVIQDSPYGIIGVANNIEMLTQSFMQLKIQTGSATGALSAMGSAFTGPMGFLVIMSLATAAMTIFSQNTKTAKQAVNEVTSALKEVTKLKNPLEGYLQLTGLTEMKNLVSSEKERLKADKVELAKLKRSTTGLSMADYYGQGKTGAGDSINSLNDKTKELQARVNASETIITTMEGQIKAQEQLAIIAQRLQPYFKYKAGSESDDKNKKDSINGLATDIKTSAGNLKESIFEMIKTDELLGILTSSSNMQKYITSLKELLPKLKKGTTEFNDTFESITKLEEKQKLLNDMRASMKDEDNLLFGVIRSEMILGDEYTNLENIAKLNGLLERLDKGSREYAETLIKINKLKENNERIKSTGVKTKDILGLVGLQGIGGEDMYRENKKFFGTMVDSPNIDWVKDKNNVLIKEGVKKQFETYKNYFIDPFTDAFKGEFSKAWQSIFGEANSLLEKFIQSLGEKLFNAGIEKAAYGLMDLIFPGSGALAGAISGGGGADSRTVNQIIIDGELIATQKQANRIKAQLDRQAALR